MSKTRLHTFFAGIRQCSPRPLYCLTTLALLGASFICALAQDFHPPLETGAATATHNRIPENRSWRANPCRIRNPNYVA